MVVLIISIVVLGIIAFLLSLSSKNEKKKVIKKSKAKPVNCCGLHEICDFGIQNMNEEVEYFDDEELDEFKGKEANAYSDSQIEIFREILYTLQKNEIHEWLYSLKLRNINIPENLMSETRMLASESSFQSETH